MKTLTQFKAEEGIQKIDLMQGNGRMFATVRNKSLIVSEKCDLKKPLFVVAVTEDKNGNPLVDVYAICNSGATVVAEV